LSPAQAMGTFLRVWREEWASPSREQLAIAVSALAPKAKVTKYVVREWERGQPPHSTAELEALLQVMGRDGLTRYETNDLRQVVLLACADRQYPELFDGQNLAWREDVDEVARTAWLQRGGTDNLVATVAGLAELEAAIAGEGRWRPGPTQLQRQQAALLCVNGTLAAFHGAAGRRGPARALSAANANLIRVWFGARGPVGDLSVLSERGGAAHHLTLASPSTATADHLLRLSGEASARDEPSVAVGAFLNAVVCFSKVGVAVHQELEATISGHLRTASVLPDCWALLADCHFELVGPALHEKLWDEADLHLEVARANYLSGGPPRRASWYEAAGSLALSRRQFTEAHNRFQEALAIARANDLDLTERALLGKLEACERGRARRGHDVGPHGLPIGAGHAEVPGVPRVPEGHAVSLPDLHAEPGVGPVTDLVEVDARVVPQGLQVDAAEAADLQQAVLQGLSADRQADGED